MAKPIRIIGAGLAGLIAACHFKEADILEAGRVNANHKALLRFRDKSVSALTGIPFKEVTVHKAIYGIDGLAPECTIPLANQYARKVTGTLSARSIWNLDSVQRYIAPDDFHAQLVDRHSRRICEEQGLDKVSEADRVFYSTISTAPLPAILAAAGMEVPQLKLDRAAINVARFRIPDCDVYQTIYFPAPHLRVFRASITGDILIVESIAYESAPRTANLTDEAELSSILYAFGINDMRNDLEPLEKVNQKYGKIVPLPSEQRHAILYELTTRFGIYSLGRFATWRNILLDDVAQDIQTVDRLVNASDYGRLHLLSK
jgi:hypothetical protein